jgi:hypothetical protein
MKRTSCKPWLILVAAALALRATPAMAVFTPYSDTPAAVIANGQSLWDNQFADMLGTAEDDTGKYPDIIFVGDFCYSGGFVDDLLDLSSTQYVGTATNWDETSLSDPTQAPNAQGDVPAFGAAFMNKAGSINAMTMAPNTLGTSFVAGNTAVNNQQTPEAGIGANPGASGTLGYAAGDQAIVFSSGDSRPTYQNIFQTDITTAYNNLTSVNLDWPVAKGSNIQVLWDQGEQIGQNNYVTGPSTISALQTAINNAFASNNFSSSNKLFIYMNDHGESTDSLKSKVVQNMNNTYNYSYQVDFSNYRNSGTDQYGAYQITLPTKDLNLGDYTNFTTNLPGTWNLALGTGTLAGNLLVLDSTPTSTGSWPSAGIDYNFSFNNPYVSAKTSWNTWEAEPSQAAATGSNSFYSPGLGGSGGIASVYSMSMDGGFNNGTAWGASPSVYDQAGYYSANVGGYISDDPAQWAGWDNGGQGWVEAPAPEPSSIALLALASTVWTSRRRPSGRCGTSRCRISGS